jgi:hypothetical protein
MSREERKIIILLFGTNTCILSQQRFETGSDNLALKQSKEHLQLGIKHFNQGMQILKKINRPFNVAASLCKYGFQQKISESGSMRYDQSRKDFS